MEDLLREIKEIEEQAKEMAEFMVSKGGVETAYKAVQSIRTDCPDNPDGMVKKIFFGYVLDYIKEHLLN